MGKTLLNLGGFTLGLFGFLIISLFYPGAIFFCTIFFIVNFVLYIKKSLNVSIIFNIAIVLGLLQLSANNYSFEYNNNVFIYSDQLGAFWSSVQEILSESTNYYDVLIKCWTTPKYSTLELTLTLFSTIYYCENYLLGTYNFITGLFFITFVSGLISCSVYKLLNFYVGKEQSLILVIYYTCFSTFTLYISYLLRDQFISLIYIYAILLFHLKPSTRNCLMFCLLIVLAYLIRPFNGVFLGALFMLYNFKVIRTNKPVLGNIVFGVTILVVIIFLSAILISFDGLIFKMFNYIDKTDEVVLNGGGLSGIIYKLPLGVKQIAIMVYSQFYYPYWYSFSNANTFADKLMSMYILQGTLGWSYVAFSVLIYFRKSFKILSNYRILKPLFLYYLLYLLLNTSNMTDRRLMAMYPVMLTLFGLLLSKLGSKQKILLSTYFVFFNLIFIVSYLYLK